MDPPDAIVHDDLSGALMSAPFHPGIPPFHSGVRGRRRRPTAIRVISRVRSEAPISWEELTARPPKPGLIRLFDKPPLDFCHGQFLSSQDNSLTDWIDKITHVYDDVSNNPIAAVFRPTDYAERFHHIFQDNQRKRWLARMTLLRWTQRVWRRRTQCNVDMIDMAPIADADAIFLTDTKHHTIFRFHRRDVFQNLLTNICMSDEMLPTPRYPTNPWTNSKLTMAQTMGLCQKLVADYARRGRCPPVLFAAFWAARFNLRRFQNENSAILSQHAINSYFKDLHDENHAVVFDTITMLLTAAGRNFSPAAIRKWLRQTPQTPLHREWLAMARDYTLYINMHVQARAHWYTEDAIYADVRALYGRTTLPDITSQRLQLLHDTSYTTIPTPPASYGLLGLPLILHMPLDLSGNALTEYIAYQMIQDALGH